MNSYILAVESSCDETAVALVDQRGRVACSKLVSQIKTHELYGGVVPEVASRAHYEEIDELMKSVLHESNVQRHEIFGIAATMGPGLIGPLLVGVSYARGLAVAWNKPFLGVHHLRGHLASVFLSDVSNHAMKESLKEISPAMVLLASGGHTQVLLLDENFNVQSLADTADDAAGECFDKAAKLMGLGYPGGPAIEQLAMTSTRGERAKGFLDRLPKPRSEQGFSFSGLKTAIRLQIEAEPKLKSDPDFCWAIEQTISLVFERALKKVYASLVKKNKSPQTLVLCGGVSANQTIRNMVIEFAQKRKMITRLPPIKYCTDNAAMIAAAAWLQTKSQNLISVEARIPLEIDDSKGALS